MNIDQGSSVYIGTFIWKPKDLPSKQKPRKETFPQNGHTVIAFTEKKDIFSSFAPKNSNIFTD